MPDAEEILNRMQLRADLATPGPWEATCTDFGHSKTDSECAVITPDVGDKVCDLQSIDRLGMNERYRDEGIADADFIAMARTDVPRLVAALRAVLHLHTDTDQICTHCGCWGDTYPCDTVKAITEALGSDHG